MARGMQNGIAQLSIGGKQQQPCSVIVQASQRVQAGDLIARNQFRDARAPLGVFHGSQKTGWFIEHQSNRLVWLVNKSPV